MSSSSVADAFNLADLSFTYWPTCGLIVFNLKQITGHPMHFVLFVGCAQEYVVKAFLLQYCARCQSPSAASCPCPPPLHVTALQNSMLLSVQGNALRESGIAKIADFGLSKVMSSYSSMFTRPASDSNLEHTSKTLQAGSSTSSEVLHRRSKSDHELAALNVDDAACTDHAQPETDAHHRVHVPSAATTVGAAVAAAKPTWNSYMRSMP